MEEPPSKRTKIDFKSAATNSINIENFPREILCIIFSYLDKKSVQNSTATCKPWFELIRGNSNLSSHIKIVKLLEFDRIQDLKLTGERWPVLKTFQFCGYFPYSYCAGKMGLLKLVNSKGCPTLETIIISASGCFTRAFPQFPRLLCGIINELTLNLKDDLKSIQVEHVTSLSLVLDLVQFRFQERAQERTLANGLKLIGNTAKNLKEVYIRFVNADEMCFYWSKSNATQEEKETMESFQKSFCQMIKPLAKSLQKVQIKVWNLNYINTLFPHMQELTDLYVWGTSLKDLQSFLNFNLAKFCQQFKNLRRFHMDVNLLLPTSTLDNNLMKLLPQKIDETFLDITEVKIRFIRGIRVFTVGKEPNQATKVSSIRFD